MSIRLKTIAKMVPRDLKTLDIGTDHALIPIYLINKNITKKVAASDISSKTLLKAKDNLLKHNIKIPLHLSDGFRNISDKFDVIIIAGLGFHTIKNIIINASYKPKYYILQSNNNTSLLREFLNKNGYVLSCEEVVFENKRYYNILKYMQGEEHLKKSEIIFGKVNNKNYYLYLYRKYKKLLKKVPINKKLLYLYYIFILKRKISGLK